MQIFPCPYLKGDVELTDEREVHIVNPSDLLPEYLPQVKQTLTDRSGTAKYPHERA